jgi:hypothetical protein
MTTARAAAALHESFTTYFGWDTYWHWGRLQVTSCE